MSFTLYESLESFCEQMGFTTLAFTPSNRFNPNNPCIDPWDFVFSFKGHVYNACLLENIKTGTTRIELDDSLLPALPLII